MLSPRLESGMSDDDGADGATANAQVRDELVERAAAHDEALAEDVGELVERVEELEARVEEQSAEMEELEEQVEDLEGRLKRKQADFENYKKRQKRQQERIRQRAAEDLVERLLDVRDNLRRAIEDDYEDVESVREGVKMTLSSFDRVLDAEGVSEIAPDPGEEIDPQRHEVMMRVDDEQPEGTVSDLYAPGYEMADKVLQAAKVTVSTGAEHEENGDGSENRDTEDDEGTSSHEETEVAEESTDRDPPTPEKNGETESPEEGANDDPEEGDETAGDTRQEDLSTSNEAEEDSSNEQNTRSENGQSDEDIQDDPAAGASDPDRASDES